MGDRFNLKEDSSYLQYMDANNLYGWVMMIQLFPTSGFNWVNLSDFTPDKIDSYANGDNEGYLLEVDVRYPKELHDSPIYLLLMCEKMKINRVEKLVPNLYDKQNYVIHIKALNQALKHEFFYSDIAENVEAKFDMGGYDKADARPLPMGKNKKVIGLMKDELRER